MKISWFTIIKNAIINDYPVVEAIQSILPVVDEMVVLVGDCDDDTELLIRSINSPKIKIHHSVWNPALRSGGEALADETNKAFALIDPEATWAFYIQADEVVHEKDYSAIIQACKKYKDDQKVKCLVFSYIHFYGTYDYVGDSRRWFSHEARIIRNDKAITSYRDAQGFRINGKRMPGKLAHASIYHYSWVKSPEQLRKKQKDIGKYWHTGEALDQLLNADNYFDYDSNFDSLERFKGSHPAVMSKRVVEQNWHLEFDVTKKQFSFKKKLLYWFEKKTGIRPFEFKNYKLH